MLEDVQEISIPITWDRLDNDINIVHDLRRIIKSNINGFNHQNKRQWVSLGQQSFFFFFIMSNY